MLRIIGGRVVRKGSYPWQVAILNRFKVTIEFHLKLIANLNPIELNCSDSRKRFVEEL